jgi:hypothetical protein
VLHPDAFKFSVISFGDAVIAAHSITSRRKPLGGTNNLYDFVPGGQGEVNGKTLVIFNTAEEVILAKTPDARYFDPSVIAPFSKVTVPGDAGYVDGLVVGKKMRRLDPTQANCSYTATYILGLCDEFEEGIK